MEKEELKSIPNLPGVYLMKDEGGNILYIGKAASLKKRVSSYFKGSPHPSARTQLMVEKVADITFFVTGSEAEALIAEAAFIRRYKPRYNVALKDDKSYPYLKLTTNERYPRLIITRKVKRDGAVYYGPYTDVKLLRKAMGLMKRIFRLRSCKRIPKKVCLNYRLGQCCAPCIGAIDESGYGDIVREVRLFLEGRRDRLIEDLSKRMGELAKRREFEKAAVLRDRIAALSVVPRPIGDARTRDISGAGGKNRRISEIAAYDELIAFMHLLSLRRVPHRIEAFDISNICGDMAVGSMITFIDGKPSKDDYRRFKIKGVTGIDDYRMMQEIIRRRYERVKKERLPSPDLIIIDGGKGQLNAALKALDGLGFGRIPVVGIAKRFERIYLKHRKEPILFSHRSPVLHLIQRLRDEAHRFAVTYHRMLRGKRLSLSVLDNVEGIGKARKKVLLNAFGSVENIKKAPMERIITLKGIDKKIAARLKRVLA